MVNRAVRDPVPIELLNAALKLPGVRVREEGSCVRDNLLMRHYSHPDALMTIGEAFDAAWADIADTFGNDRLPTLTAGHIIGNTP